VAAEVAADVVPAAFEFSHHSRRNATFQIHPTAARHFWHVVVGRAFVLPARGVAGFLHAETEVHEVHYDLHVALRLHRATHDTEAHERLAVLHDERRDDRVERTFAGRVDVGVPATFSS
jgi:hypothetical protein